MRARRIAPAPGDRSAAGVVAGLFIKRARHEPMDEVVSAGAARRRGLVGDCHAKPVGPRQVLVVRQEPLDELGIAPWQVRANIATYGLPEEALESGRVIRVGHDVQIRITHLCEVCNVLRAYVPAEDLRRLPRRRGSLGVVLEGGAVAVGDPVSLEPTGYPRVPEAIDRRVEWVARRVPRGRVVTYATLLDLAGGSRPYFRALPAYLRRAAANGAPAHRVVTSSGQLAGNVPDQRRLLESEGIALDRSDRLIQPAPLWDGRGIYLSKT